MLGVAEVEDIVDEPMVGAVNGEGVEVEVVGEEEITRELMVGVKEVGGPNYDGVETV